MIRPSVRPRLKPMENEILHAAVGAAKRTAPTGIEKLFGVAHPAFPP